MIDELRIAARALLRARSTTALQLATVAIGVGGVSAVLGVVSAVVLQPLPFERPGSLVTLDVTSSRGFQISASIPNYRDWRDRSRSFESFGGSAGWTFRLTRNEGVEVLEGAAVYGDFFRVLRVEPALGRAFAAVETEPGTPGLAMLGYTTWQRTFGGDSGIVGRVIQLGGEPYTITGVLPSGFAFPRTEPQLVVNMGSISGLPWEQRRSSFGTRIYARLRPGTTLDAALADVNRVGREVRELNGPDTALPSARSLGDFLLSESARQLWLLLAAVGTVLLIALANAGGLVLARAADQRRDAAVRVALGGRMQDVRRQFLHENVLLTLVAGAMGLGIATLLVRALAPMLPDNLPESLLSRIAVDRWTVVSTMSVCLLTGVLFGLAAAAHAAPSQLTAALRAGSQAVVGSRSRARTALVVLETALSLVLAVSSGLLLASFLRLQHSDKGFDPSNVLSARIAGSSTALDSRDKWLAYHETLLERAKALPGVKATAASLLVPLSDRSWELSIQPEGSTQAVNEGPSVLFNIVSEDYFTALGVPLLEGRAFTGSDVNESLPVAIVDATMAERFWPGERAIGKRVTIGEQGPDSMLVYRTVVGVAKNVRHYSVATPSRIQVYVPLRQTLARWGQGLNLVVRTSGAPASLIPPLRRLGTSIDSRVPIWSFRPAAEYLDQSIAGERALGVITIWLAAVATLVTAVGLFGIVSYSVLQRRREFALRMALGATPHAVAVRVTRGAIAMSAAGIVIGLVASVGLSRFIRTFLYGVEPLDWRAYAMSVLALFAISLMASLAPALAARRLSPAQVLRED